MAGWKSGPSGVIIRQNNSNRECLGTYSVDWSILIVRPVGDLSPCGAHLCLGYCDIVSIDTATTQRATEPAEPNSLNAPPLTILLGFVNGTGRALLAGPLAPASG